MESYGFVRPFECQKITVLSGSQTRGELRQVIAGLGISSHVNCHGVGAFYCVHVRIERRIMRNRYCPCLIHPPPMTKSSW